MASPMIQTKPRKSIGLAVFLAFLLGPLGLFYVSIREGIILTFVVPAILFLLFVFGLGYENPILLVFTMGFSLIYIIGYWVIAMIWAFISARNYNREVDEYNRQQMELFYGMNKSHSSPANVNIPQQSSSPADNKQEMSHSGKPPLREWLRNNPDKSINDYYILYGRD